VAATASVLADRAFGLLIPSVPASARLEPAQLEPGLLRDLTQELLLGEPRRAERSESLTGLLIAPVDDRGRSQAGDKKGVVATLTLEAIPDGTGLLYPTPALAFVGRDGLFREAEQNAATALQQTYQLWHATWDVRWSLHRQDGIPLLHRLEGNSLGGAFGLGLATLLAGRRA